MSQEIEFLYDFGSPNAYLVEQVLPGLAERHGATIRRVPVFLGGIFKATGNQSPLFAFADIPGKVDYMRTEIDRFVRRHDVDFLWTPHFPILSIHLMRGAIFAEGMPWEDTYRDTVWRACWVDGRNMTEPEVIVQVLAAAGLPVEDIMAGVQDEGVKKRLFATTEAAVSRGVFGVPALFHEGELFFGKDSLNDLDWALGR